MSEEYSYTDSGDFPDNPYETDSDRLYEIYRHGIITRHICSNGRLDELTLLVERSAYFDETSQIRPRIDYNRRRRPESWTDIETGLSMSEKIKTWWPAYSQSTPGTFDASIIPLSGHETISLPDSMGTGDNPLLSTGLALAAFSIEAMKGISKHSFKYARLLFNFILQSEERTNRGIGTGFFVRGRGFQSRNHKHKYQGASVDEYVGMMVGILYYYKLCIKISNDSELTRVRDLVTRWANTMDKHGYWILPSEGTGAELDYGHALGGVGFAHIFRIFFKYITDIDTNPFWDKAEFIRYFGTYSLKGFLTNISIDALIAIEDKCDINWYEYAAVLVDPTGFLAALNVTAKKGCQKIIDALKSVDREAWLNRENKSVGNWIAAYFIRNLSLFAIPEFAVLGFDSIEFFLRMLDVGVPLSRIPEDYPEKAEVLFDIIELALDTAIIGTTSSTLPLAGTILGYKLTELLEPKLDEMKEKLLTKLADSMKYFNYSMISEGVIIAKEIYEDVDGINFIIEGVRERLIAICENVDSWAPWPIPWFVPDGNCRQFVEISTQGAEILGWVVPTIDPLQRIRSSSVTAYNWLMGTTGSPKVGSMNALFGLISSYCRGTPRDIDKAALDILLDKNPELNNPLTPEGNHIWQHDLPIVSIWSEEKRNFNVASRWGQERTWEHKNRNHVLKANKYEGNGARKAIVLSNLEQEFTPTGSAPEFVVEACALGLFFPRILAAHWDLLPWPELKKDKLWPTLPYLGACPGRTWNYFHWYAPDRSHHYHRKLAALVERDGNSVRHIPTDVGLRIPFTFYDKNGYIINPSDSAFRGGRRYVYDDPLPNGLMGMMGLRGGAFAWEWYVEISERSEILEAIPPTYWNPSMEDIRGEQYAKLAVRRYRSSDGSSLATALAMNGTEPLGEKGKVFDYIFKRYNYVKYLGLGWTRGPPSLSYFIVREKHATLREVLDETLYPPVRNRADDLCIYDTWDTSRITGDTTPTSSFLFYRIKARPIFPSIGNEKTCIAGTINTYWIRYNQTASISPQFRYILNPHTGTIHDLKEHEHPGYSEMGEAYNIMILPISKDQELVDLSDSELQSIVASAIETGNPSTSYEYEEFPIAFTRKDFVRRTGRRPPTNLPRYNVLEIPADPDYQPYSPWNSGYYIPYSRHLVYLSEHPDAMNRYVKLNKRGLHLCSYCFR